MQQTSQNLQTRIPQFTQDQYNQILQLLEKQPECSGSTMVAYAGASSHMVNDSSLLINTKSIDIKGGKVHLPTGSVTHVSHIGSVAFPKDLIVSNVMYIPEFKYNLLFVSKLTKEMRWIVMFFPDFFIFQELFNGKVMGIGREEDGLYVFNSTPKKSVVLQSQSQGLVADILNDPRQINSVNTVKVPNKVVSISVWHKRLGHAPLDTLQKLKAAYSTIVEPKSCTEAVKDAKWVKAMKCEISALEDNHTWTKVDLPLGKVPIDYAGASSHMVNDSSLLINAKSIDIKGGKVHLPTGNVTHVSHIGSVAFLKDLIVTNVIYIPDFKYNLLFVSKLTKEMRWIVMFFPDFFIFQELFSGQVRGIGREEDGLYVFNSTSKKSVALQSQIQGSVADILNGPRQINSVNTVKVPNKAVSIVVWHKRLGHAPLDTLQKLKAAYSAIVEPKSYTEAVKDAKWVEAMKCEISALEDNHTWTVVDLPPGKIPIGSKIVTVRSVLAIAAAKHWAIFQMDVHNAFLKGDLLEDVYIEFPPGKVESELILVLVYVDDLLVTGSSQRLNLQTRNDLKLTFKMKDLGELKFFLGIEFARSSKGIVMSQRKYALELIAEMGLSGAKPIGIPLEANVKLTSEEYDMFIHNQSSLEAEDKLLADARKYQRLIGKLLYLTMTRVDIAYVVQVLSQYMHKPK
ncbi:uncharacterized protein LOC142161877 [Nicotiana tabacum]|uniref:Uncharacterized protein LOC142161877 n=1 Tax=Nicotiana tabacum TaxID=4097 RepID=A0AC58RMI4_TOBAC